TKAAKAAEAAVEVARANAHLDQRAWVAPVEIIGTPTENEAFVITVKIKNTGKTFAKNLRAIKVVEEVKKGEEPHFVEDTMDTKDLPGEEIPSITLLAPNQDYLGKLALKHDMIITKAYLEQLKSGDILAFSHGIIRYDDIFGQSHWTTYCAFLNRDLKD